MEKWITDSRTNTRKLRRFSPSFIPSRPSLLTSIKAEFYRPASLGVQFTFMTKNKTKCVVCGARVPDSRCPYDTCDRTCARAKGNSLSRMEQFQAEIRRDAVASRFENQESVNQQRRQHEIEENEHYNRPMYIKG
jgi:hypothetical protein